MIEADTPSLWEIRSHTDHATAIGIIVIALIHTARLVNLENNLNETQIGEIANDIIEDFGYLKVEELKHVLKTAVKSQKIFGRLDYNVVMNWFRDYDAERTEEAIRLSDQIASEARHALAVDNPDAITAAQYKELLEKRVAEGDGEAAWKLEMLGNAKNIVGGRDRENDLGFFKWYHETYRKNKKQNE